MSAIEDDHEVEGKRKGQREKTGVQSLERAFAILEIIASHRDGISLANLSKEVGLHSSTTYHLARTMTSLGYVRQDPDNKRYFVGRMVFSIAANSRYEIDIVTIAGPILDDLSQATGESSHLAMVSGDDIVIVARTNGTGAFQLQERHGGVRPGHATALGKVILAGMTADELARYLETHPMTQLTPKTITDQGMLLRELERTRETGFAYDDGEFNAEVRCVAYAVRDFTGRVIGSIGVSGPIWRVTLQSLQALTTMVEEAGQRLSSELGDGGVR
ncbi:IclR family transcriptional regulator [Acuticoccus kandeliae]|uniref:IclR family transcriptional regulator n=1 Tax=Acuticoccus kandeliae TaxID=2073160 RepID=UPI000D3E5DEA|nr:IclR family transcriptional regulator [Acuticoccus kandeliae]